MRFRDILENSPPYSYTLAERVGEQMAPGGQVLVRAYDNEQCLRRVVGVLEDVVLVCRDVCSQRKLSHCAHMVR